MNLLFWLWKYFYEIGGTPPYADPDLTVSRRNDMRAITRGCTLLNIFRPSLETISRGETLTIIERMNAGTLTITRHAETLEVSQ